MRFARLSWPVALTLVTIAGAGWAVSRHVPALAQGPRPDSIVIADSAYKLCGSRTEKQECYENFLTPLIATKGVRVTMGALDMIGRHDAWVRDEGHVLAHGIGITAGLASHDMATTFSSCSETFQSGCQHGVIQAYFQNVHTADTANVNALCRPYDADNNRWLRFQCVHGMGHGLTMLYQHDLPKALQGCDLLSDGWDRDSCYGGAFMENLINVTNPHHPAHALMAGMHMEGMDDHAAHPFKALDSTDLHYPCTIMAERYLEACYGMQTSVMLWFNHGNVASAAEACRHAPGTMKYVCAQSLGRDIASISHQDTREEIRLCSLADPEYQPWCHIGVAKNLVDLGARADDGFAYCRAVSGARNKLRCYNAIGEQVATLKGGMSERAELCGHAESAYREACRGGAGIGAVPSAMPQPKVS
ncbi:MAG TPA: hypothetical protein VGI92_09525 [Gemmatimonadales bacterium]|jgi:hypothetical protein